VAASQAWLAATAGPAPLSEPTPGRPQTATRKAELLAQRQGVDLGAVPTTGERISEADVLAYLAQQKKPPTQKTETVDIADLVDQRYPVNRIQRLLILGGATVRSKLWTCSPRGAANAQSPSWTTTGPCTAVSSPGCRWWGIDSGQAAAMLASGEIDAARVLSQHQHCRTRAALREPRAQGLPFANVIHPSAVLGMNVTMGTGNVVMAFCHFGACATVGDNNFLSAYCSIEHHSAPRQPLHFGPVSSPPAGYRSRIASGLAPESSSSLGAHRRRERDCIRAGHHPADSRPVNGQSPGHVHDPKTGINQTDRPKRS
jgi:hypothetical protein